MIALVPVKQHQSTYRQTSNIIGILEAIKLLITLMYCSWSSVDRLCSNYIFILDLTPDFNRLGKDNCKTRRETFKITKSRNKAWTTSNYSHALRWRHNERDSVSNHQPHDCLLNRLFRRRSKKSSKLRVTGLCVGNSPGTGEFPAQMASYTENVSIWWRHHGTERWCNSTPRPVFV